MEATRKQPKQNRPTSASVPKKFADLFSLGIGGPKFNVTSCESFDGMLVVFHVKPGKKSQMSILEKMVESAEFRLVLFDRSTISESDRRKCITMVLDRLCPGSKNRCGASRRPSADPSSQSRQMAKN